MLDVWWLLRAKNFNFCRCRYHFLVSGGRLNGELKQHNNGTINHVKCGQSRVLVVLVIQTR